MPPVETRKRKACLPCIRAKAKCSPSEPPSDRCHRCTRLSKHCEFEVVAKKPGPGPKSRSRVRQLEQRVESLIGLITAKNDVSSSTSTATNPSFEPAENTIPPQVVTPDSTEPDTPKDPACYWIESPPYQAYDPIQTGAIDEQHAYHLVEEFKTSFITSFPFVIVELDAPTLRLTKPFLFHAILAVTAYDTPQIQCFLADELRRQVARVIEHSRKSLEILQGLLVYGAWYHSFYQPASQQLAIVAQLCVALVQDLGISRNATTKSGKWSVVDCSMTTRPKGSLTEKRAYLGTFFLTVIYAQAWRKRTTLSYTCFMAQCCEAFDGSVIPTDALIRPLIQSCELLSRVNDHFSYDDIDNSDIRGEMMLNISVTSFLRELKGIKEAASAIAKGNTTLSLMFYLLDVGINEVSLYSSLWRVPSRLTTTSPPALIRLKTLHRTMEAAVSYLNILIETPQSLLLQLGLSSWAGWFYVVIIICKLVFLDENECLGQTRLEDISEEIDNMIPQNIDHGVPHTTDAEIQAGADGSGWDALSVAREYEIQPLFDRLMMKMRFTLPEGSAPWSKSRMERDALYAIGCIQHTMLHGFAKRMERVRSKINTSHINLGSATNPNPAATPNRAAYVHSGTTWQPPQITTERVHIQPAGPIGIPFASFMNFDSINFDSVTLPTSSFPTQDKQEMLGDWMRNMVMDDFTIPSL